MSDQISENLIKAIRDAVKTELQEAGLESEEFVLSQTRKNLTSKVFQFKCEIIDNEGKISTFQHQGCFIDIKKNVYFLSCDHKEFDEKNIKQIKMIFPTLEGKRTDKCKLLRRKCSATGRYYDAFLLEANSWIQEGIIQKESMVLEDIIDEPKGWARYFGFFANSDSPVTFSTGYFLRKGPEEDVYDMPAAPGTSGGLIGKKEKIVGMVTGGENLIEEKHSFFKDKNNSDPQNLKKDLFRAIENLIMFSTHSKLVTLVLPLKDFIREQGLIEVIPSKFCLVSFEKNSMFAGLQLKKPGFNFLNKRKKAKSFDFEKKKFEEKKDDAEKKK